jgi:hypothetical protein
MLDKDGVARVAGIKPSSVTGLLSRLRRRQVNPGKYGPVTEVDIPEPAGYERRSYTTRNGFYEVPVWDEQDIAAWRACVDGAPAPVGQQRVGGRFAGVAS